MRIRGWGSDVCSSDLPAVIGEPEAAVAIEDDVVRALERFALEPVVERDHRAGGEVDALDRAAGRLVGGMAREEQRAGLDPLETAVVAHIGGAVRADRKTVRAAAKLGDERQAALGRTAGQRAARLDEHTSELQSIMPIYYAT